MKKATTILATVFSLLTLASCDIKKETKHEAITIMDAQRDYRELIKLVKSKYPEINIEIIPYRGKNRSAYMKQQLVTGDMPDIYSTTQAWDGTLQKQNLLDLSEYNVSSLYNTARINKYLVDGALYLLPFDFSVNGICYNATLFEKLNIEVPTSFKILKEETIPALTKANVEIATCLIDLPGSAFNYFFNISSTMFMNSNTGIKWRNSFADISSDTYASGNENILNCVNYIQEWIDCGLLNYEESISNDHSSVVNKFEEGNTAFMIGSINRFSQNDDGTGDQYRILPYLSEDGSNNNYMTTPGCLYGLNKNLGTKKNKQKLEDALHVLEVLSSNEGYKAICGNTSTNLCSINDFDLTEGNKYYSNAIDALKKGHSIDAVYVGWESYLKPFGNALCDWIKSKDANKASVALKVLDDTKKDEKEKGSAPYYGIVDETLDTIDAAKLTGQIFLDATSADAALVSYNVYNENIHAIMENSNGANGKILKGKLTEENIVIWLATGWAETIITANKTGKEIKEMSSTGADTRGNGFHYPYVFLTKDGKELNDNTKYNVVLVGYNINEKDNLGLVDTGIVGLEAAKTYLSKIGTINKKAINEDLVIS